MSETKQSLEEFLFEEAVRRSSTERAAFLNGVCKNDPVLRARLDLLLEGHAQAHGFLTEVPPRDTMLVVPPPPEHDKDEPSIERIDRYKLLEKIGEGGFGAVYIAEQKEPIKRRVALKIIKLGMDTRQVVARFEAERQALALMDHPNIAKVLDAGTTDTGRPYFVMELVRGIPITRYCDQERLSTHDRLNLFIKVCHAIQHAHQKGIIHRDIKPSNILVTLHDGVPVPKVIDFGIAKATQGELTDKTIYTQFQQFIGTPAYMSPEQAEMSGLNMDTRSDIYSLGVLLYELLTGDTPFNARELLKQGLDEMRRTIREVEPTRPSTHLSTLPNGDLTEVARRRHTDPPKLVGLVRGDLDWIVVKCLEKDRTRRYETTNAMALDLRRHLNHEPVLARPPSATYRLQKFVRRKRIPLALGACAAAGLVLALTFAALAYLGQLHARLATASKKEQTRAREMDLPQLKRLIEASQLVPAFQLARTIEQVLPEDPVLSELETNLTATGNVVSEPAGARVSIRDWNSVDDTWLEIGTTPLNLIRLPRGELRWKFEKEGCIPREVQQPFPGIGTVSLSRQSEVPDGMVLVAPPIPSAEVPAPFLIDRYEVSNVQFQRFVDAGGYQSDRYWKKGFTESGVTLSWEEAMKRLVDQTGHAGPATWVNGHFPAGGENYPVCGVSWYEAAAYAEFVHKSLPSIFHWKTAASQGPRLDRVQFIVPLSNFRGQGVRPVGSFRGIGLYDVYDMAGNVSEWCFNAAGDGMHCLCGGAWDTPEYLFVLVDNDSTFRRLPRYGFRCVKYLQNPPAGALAAKRDPGEHDRKMENSMTLDDLAAYKRQYLYDTNTPLHAQVGASSDLNEQTRHEVVRIDAAYDGEQFDIHLFLPRHSRPPYQALVLFPDIGASQPVRFEEGYAQIFFFRSMIGLAERGWALCWPVYKGTFERHVPHSELEPMSVSGRAHYIKMAKDLSRTVDYLNTRSDIESEKLAYLGSSWGALMGPVMVVVEPRFKAAVFIGGGLWNKPVMPEVDPFPFSPYVRVPVLMISGKYDTSFPLESAQMRLYRNLGTTDKLFKQFDSGHVTPARETIEVTDQWLREKLRTRRGEDQ